MSRLRYLNAGENLTALPEALSGLPRLRRPALLGELEQRGCVVLV